MIKERAEERQIQELQEMQEAAGGQKRLNRVDWMYNGGPSAGQAGVTEEMEGYLLGKRRIDTLLKDKESKRLEKAATEESFMALQHANTLRDTASKIRDDPILAIKRQEQEAFEAMMKDPVRRRALLKAAGQDGEEATGGKHRKRHRRDSHDGHERHRHRNDRDRDLPNREKNRRDRYAKDRYEEDPYSSRRSRRYDDHDKSRHRNGGDRRRRSSSSSSSRSLTPPRRRSRSPHHRSASPHRRSYSPRRRSPSSPHHHRRRLSPRPPRSRSPPRNGNSRHDLKHSKSWAQPQPQPRRPSPPHDDDRAAKLAAMQQAASELDQDREQRLQSLAEKEAADLKAEEDARARSSRYGGGKGDFLSGVNRRAGELGVGERMQRGRGGFVKDGE
ncbi:MAG: hypothetical protein LQ340_001463 [Diploschistes diacapsis]|nr:MAG: hypothetical protein LQ340_001463 [Diploschistes diacapsis]